MIQRILFWLAVIFMLTMIRKSAYILWLALERTTHAPMHYVVDEEILFAHEYVNRSVSVKAEYIFAFLIKTGLSFTPLIFIKNEYMTQIYTIFLVSLIIAFVCLVSYLVDAAASNYELHIYQKGLRLAWIEKGKPSKED